MEGGTEEGSGDENLYQEIKSYGSILESFKKDLKSLLVSSPVRKSEVATTPTAPILKRFPDDDSTVKILKRKNNTSNKTDKSTKTQTPAISSTEDCYYPYYAENNEYVKAICHEIWVKFSNKHQKSPSHINNNVQSCEKFNKEIGPGENNKSKQLQSHKNNCTGTCNKTFSYCHEDQDMERKGSAPSIIQGAPLKGLNLDSQISNNNESAFQTLVQKLFGLLQLFLSLLKIMGLIFITVIFLYCLIALHKPTQAFVSRHTQDFIYPFMRGLRLISLPMVRRLPILTDFYEESCLFSNPFYAIDDLDCWPCESVRHVIDLTGFSNFSSAYHHSGIPFIVKDAFKTELGMNKFRKIYSENQKVIGKSFIESNRLGLTTLEELFSLENQHFLKQDDFHLEWKINRVTTARLWRKYFPKPYFIPAATEVSVQHFLFLDQTLSRTYPMPLTEFANVFVTQAGGSRSIVLIPTEKCKSHCKVVSAVLQPKDVLFYNWLFWRPMSIPADATSKSKGISITYIGSFY